MQCIISILRMLLRTLFMTPQRVGLAAVKLRAEAVAHLKTE